MNRTHRVIWSESRNAFIVTGEDAKAKGKPKSSSTRKKLASAVVMALAAMAAEPAMAGAIGQTWNGGNINNSGSIVGTNTGIYANTNFTGSITNSGTINGTANYGIHLNTSSVSGSITNSGTISGGRTGIALTFGSASGNITNSGTISGNSVGIYLNSGTVSGGITNSGTISGNSLGIYLNVGTVSGGITNSGTISGGRTGIKIYTGSTVAGGIINSGTIKGTTRDGIFLTLSTVSGGITNASGGTISGGLTGIKITSHSTVTGDITNSGTITGTGNGGIAVLQHSSVSGDITNTGKIFANTNGIHFSASTLSGSITNTGTISQAHTGISIFKSTVSGSITNTGSIDGVTGPGIYILTSSTISSGITNSGTISGNTFAISSKATSTLPTIVNQSGGLINGALYILSATNVSNAGAIALPATTTSTITGNYTQTSAGSNNGLSIGVANQGSSAILNVSGTASFNSGAHIYVNVTTPGAALAGSSLTSAILNATGGITGTTFTVKSNSTSDLFTATIVGNAIDLSYTACTCTASTFGGGSVLSSVTTEGNNLGKGAAAVFDTLSAATGDMGTVYTTLTGLGVAAQSTAVTSTLPLMTGGMAIATAGNLQGVNKVVQARQDENVGLSSGDDFITERNAWVKPIGSWANQSDSNGASGYKAQTSGIVFGADKALSPITRIGAAFAVTHSNIDNNLGSQTAGVSSYQAVLYGSRSLDDKRTELNWQADYATNQNTGDRNINFMARTAAANYNSDSFHLGAGVGRTLDINPETSFTPSFRADYTTIHSNAYTETGAGALNLAVDAQTTDEFILAIDGKVAHKLNDQSTLTANLGVGYDTMAKQSSITAAYAGGGAAFTTSGINPSPTIVSGGLGVVMKSSKTVEVTARYDVEARSGFTDQTISAKVRWPF